MKLHKIIFSLAMGLVAGDLWGQNLSTKGPPSPPYLKQAPEMSAWTVQFTPLKGNSDTSKRGSEIRQINVTRTHQLRSVMVNYQNGETGELWSNGSCFIENATKWPSPVIVNSTHGSIDPSALHEYQSSDFPDFTWASKETYSGTVQIDDRNCLVFRKEIERNTASQDKETVTAWIDESTRLPVQCIRNNVIRKIVFSAPPSELLVFPPKVAEIIRQMNRLLDITNTRAPKGG